MYFQSRDIIKLSNKGTKLDSHGRRGRYEQSGRRKEDGRAYAFVWVGCVACRRV